MIIYGILLCELCSFTLALAMNVQRFALSVSDEWFVKQRTRVQWPQHWTGSSGILSVLRVPIYLLNRCFFVKPWFCCGRRKKVGRGEREGQSPSDSPAETPTDEEATCPASDGEQAKAEIGSSVTDIPTSTARNRLWAFGVCLYGLSNLFYFAGLSFAPLALICKNG